jgi:hypothetical protein
MVLPSAVSTLKLPRVKNLTRVSFALLALAAAFTTHAQAVKWHPGHYVTLNTGSGGTDARWQLDEIAKEPTIKGAQLYVWWYQLEKSKGVYDFSAIDLYLNKLKTLSTPKRLVVQIRDRRFGGTSKTGIIPNYMLSDPIYKGGVAYQPNVGNVARLWDTAVMDRLIALYRALGTRYNSNPYVEGFITGETAIGFGSDKSKWPSGFSQTALLNQFVRFARSARTTMPQTNLFMNTNSLGSDADMGTLIQALYESDVAAGGPSTIPNRLLSSQRVWTGATGADYRGLIAIGTGLEEFVFGGKHGDFTPKQIGDWAYNPLRVTHLFWFRNTWVGTSAQQWSKGILPYLRTNPPTRTACPTAYGTCNTN